ncbi:MAG: sodium-dependent bicarbonate transport family permease [Actinobacteria bacterium]|nr:sodium-dependent bicarbonate transport family permease [Actinomycetota bacterium]
MYSFAFLRFRRYDPFESAAIAGTYGSVSAVTFITAQQFARKEPSSAATWRWRWC